MFHKTTFYICLDFSIPLLSDHLQTVMVLQRGEEIINGDSVSALCGDLDMFFFIQYTVHKMAFDHYSKHR